MGSSDLHSIAYNSSLGWDLHRNLGVFNPDMSQFLESSIHGTPPFLSQFESDFSTGYLQDALFEFSSKRRRLEFCTSDDDDHHKQQDLFSNPRRSCRSPTYSTDCFDDYDYLSKIMTKSDSISVEPMSEDASIFSELKTREEAMSSAETFDTTATTTTTTTSVSSSRKDSVCSSINMTQSISDKEENLPSMEDTFSPSGEINDDDDEKKMMTTTTRRKKSGKVVYPFALVKPGGREGDVTIKDINERILMPPSRPVRHPVGDFACRPLVVSADGPGLSGKAVVALTRIHTRGRGTITIIRTRG